MKKTELVAILNSQIDKYEEQKNYNTAIKLAKRIIKFQPLNFEAHQKIYTLMRNRNSYSIKLDYADDPNRSLIFFKELKNHNEFLNFTFQCLIKILDNLQLDPGYKHTATFLINFTVALITRGMFIEMARITGILSNNIDYPKDVPIKIKKEMLNKLAVLSKENSTISSFLQELNGILETFNYSPI
jgi:hypothetical protein